VTFPSETSPNGSGDGHEPAGETSASPDRPAWYKHRSLVVAVVVAVILGVTIVSDLPQHTSRSQQIQEEATVVGEIQTYAAECIAAVKEAFGFYSDQQAGSLTASDRAAVPALLDEDQAACSFTSEYVYDLANIEVPGSAAGRDLGDVVAVVTLWVTSDALQAIDAITALMNAPRSSGQLRALAAAERLLASDRAKAGGDIAAADRALGGASLPSLGLPSLPVPQAS